ncbi:acyl-CoA thioesterase [Oscillatoria sp. FACHB-1407]|uniref:acyl-CoA thioesterase n=1 Tax=Oscillatoria sp. FACHB-1407 TaxID=2692847 RepID=UPI0016891494|nr:thioesterase family protein [Oscillatoria sp. FACHB-1407]MBD2459961.1 acyl-CoA thioesterase [Oscillatoria sp. FACHB-1407]
MSFIYPRSVHFKDTDAAGVVYFANVMSMCHEAYEASLAASGIDLNSFFCYPKIAIPITHVTVDFMRPMFCGDNLQIHVNPKQLKGDEFEIQYEVYSVEKVVEEITSVQEVCTARAFSKHVCIDAVNRVRTNLPIHVMQWLERWGKPLNESVELL